MGAVLNFSVCRKALKMFQSARPDGPEEAEPGGVSAGIAEATKLRAREGAT
jgi:hypothetical protein